MYRLLVGCSERDTVLAARKTSDDATELWKARVRNREAVADGGGSDPFAVDQHAERGCALDLGTNFNDARDELFENTLPSLGMKVGNDEIFRQEVADLHRG